MLYCAVPGTVPLLSACDAPATAGAKPSRCLAASCGQVIPAHGRGWSSFPYFLGCFGWVWTRMLGELWWGLGTELPCCLAASLKPLPHCRPDLMEERNKFL